VAVVGKEMRSVGRDQDFVGTGPEAAVFALGLTLIPPLEICFAIAKGAIAQLTNPDNNATVTTVIVNSIT
jgi:hypothetical protein